MYSDNVHKDSCKNLVSFRQVSSNIHLFGTMLTFPTCLLLYVDAETWSMEQDTCEGGIICCPYQMMTIKV